MIVGFVEGLMVLGIGICFISGMIAIVKGCEVLNENIKKWD